MVNAASDNSYEHSGVTVDLGTLKGNPVAEQMAAAFIASLKGNEAQRMMNVVVPINGHHVQKTPTESPFRHGCSPSDWFNDEAQMTRGGTGTGGNWLD